MLEKLYALKEIIGAYIEEYRSGERCLSCLDIALIIINIFLLGILIGMLVSPRKNVMIGSNNGNGYPVEDGENEE